MSSVGGDGVNEDQIRSLVHTMTFHLYSDGRQDTGLFSSGGIWYSAQRPCPYEISAAQAVQIISWVAGDTPYLCELYIRRDISVSHYSCNICQFHRRPVFHNLQGNPHEEYIVHSH